MPNLNFRIEHRFKELEIGPITEMFQSVDFRLDRSGATLISEAFVVYELGIACQLPLHWPVPDRDVQARVCGAVFCDVGG